MEQKRKSNGRGLVYGKEPIREEDESCLPVLTEEL